VIVGRCVWKLSTAKHDTVIVFLVVAVCDGFVYVGGGGGGCIGTCEGYLLLLLLLISLPNDVGWLVVACGTGCHLKTHHTCW
jgi:hypothetical protein